MGTSFFVSGSVIALRLSLLKGCMFYAAAAKLLQSCLTLCNPHIWQPTRLLHPWDSPGKNTEVGCHFLLQYVLWPLANSTITSILQKQGARTGSFPLCYKRDTCVQVFLGPAPGETHWPWGTNASYSSQPCSVLLVLFKIILQDKVFIYILIFIYI